ncbi:MAG: hypothetical protein AAGC56_09140 [Pseudomonadota bacterium]
MFLSPVFVALLAFIGFILVVTSIYMLDHALSRAVSVLASRRQGAAVLKV